ncbi:MAG: UDP-N-acetylglucosamine 1-carboxyvinyltransferase [Oscillospiraceae bacterium]|nr:UDP-N-acetylglucosamine 1-carboxyvinyltransferase [Oscillospiraceae bacterium]
MSHITIHGTAPLRGEVTVQRAKNSVLPLLAAALLHRGSCRIENCPRLSDVGAARDIMEHLGCRVHWEGRDLVVDATQVTRADIPPSLMSQFRSSVVFLGAILARCGEATLSYPGGCELGPRPIDLHLAALRTLGAEIEETGGILRCRGKLRGCEILLPFPSVGATENAMLAATAAKGSTTISNAAREPEIVDLQDFLQKLGISIHGAGTSTITIRGGAPLHETTHRPIPDRIVTATYLCAAAACGGEITLRDTDYRHLAPVTTALHQAGCCLRCREDSITLRSTGQLRSLPPVRTYPYPGFPTDAQPVLMAALLRARGATMFVENIFENRYRQVAELTRMGADIRLEGKVALLSGVERLYGGEVHATDLRGGAALTVAALQAEGTTTLSDIHHILRGYEDISRDLRALGADITFTT